MSRAMKWGVGFAFLAVVACSGSTPQYGNLKLSVTSSALSSDPRVTSVWVQILGVDAGMGWAGVQGEIYNSKADKTGEWQALFDKIPVGHVSFYAEARGAGGVVLYKVVDPRPVYEVLPRTITNVLLLLQDTQATPFGNHAPYIESLIYGDGEIDPGATINLVATAGDPDPGEALTYAWSSDGGGTFSDAGALATTWQPPGEGTFNLTLLVTDEHGAQAGLTALIHVAARNATGGFFLVIELNNFPAIARISTPDAEGRVGSPITLTADASDADGDPLTYAWTATCAPGVTLAGNPATFTPEALGDCDFTVVVTDGRGGSNTGTLTVRVGDTSAVEAPQFYVKLATPVDIFPGQKAEVQVMPASGHSEPGWTFEWDDGGFGGSFVQRTLDGFTDNSDEWYTPRLCTTGTTENVTITATVTDSATGGTNSESLTVVVHCDKTLDVLILGTTVTGGAASAEAQATADLGYNPVILDAAQWAALTSSDIAAARAIVLGTPTTGSGGCSAGDATPLDPAAANRSMWTPNVGGNVLLAGNDPSYHYATVPGANEFLHDAIAFAAWDPANTGAYISLACYYAFTVGTAVPVVDGFGSFTVNGVGANVAHVVGTHPALASLTDADLSYWGTSIHEIVDASPTPTFVPFAVATEAGSAPYIVGRGVTLP